MFTFVLNHSKTGRRKVVLATFAVVLAFFSAVVYMVSFSGEHTSEHPALLLIPVAAMLIIASGLVYVSRNLSFTDTAFRVGITEDGLWVGEEFFDFTWLEKVEVTELHPQRSQKLYLQVRWNLVKHAKYFLGRTSAGARTTFVGDYAQFLQVLDHTAKRANPELVIERVD